MFGRLFAKKIKTFTMIQNSGTNATLTQRWKFYPVICQRLKLKLFMSIFDLN